MQQNRDSFSSAYIPHTHTHTSGCKRRWRNDGPVIDQSTSNPRDVSSIPDNDLSRLEEIILHNPPNWERVLVKCCPERNKQFSKDLITFT